MHDIYFFIIKVEVRSTRTFIGTHHIHMYTIDLNSIIYNSIRKTHKKKKEKKAQYSNLQLNYSAHKYRAELVTQNHY